MLYAHVSFFFFFGLCYRMTSVGLFAPVLVACSRGAVQRDGCTVVPRAFGVAWRGMAWRAPPVVGFPACGGQCDPNIFRLALVWLETDWRFLYYQTYFKNTNNNGRAI